MRKLKSILSLSICALFLVVGGAVAMTDFSDGVSSYGIPLPAGNYVTSGNYHFVDSGHAAASDAADKGGSWDKPYATLDFAVGRCTANNGDVIFVAANHEENLSAADGVDVDVDGVRIVGVADGDDMPEFTYTNAAGEFVIGATNVTVENIRFIPSITSITMAISVEAGGDDFTLRNCKFTEGEADVDEFLDAIDLASGADRVKIIGNEYICANATGAAHFVEAGNGVNNELVITDNVIHGEFSTAAIWSDTADKEVYIARNSVTQMTAGQHCIEFSSTATGAIENNCLYTDAMANVLDPGSMTVSGNTWNAIDSADTAAIDIPLIPGKTYAITVSADEVTANLFDVAGGAIFVESFVGIVDVDIGAAATTCEIFLDADSGNNYDLSTAVAITGDAAGSRYVFSAANESVLTPLEGADGGSTQLMKGWFVDEGMLEQTMSADPGGAAGDHITWFMTFHPLEENVTVTAQ